MAPPRNQLCLCQYFNNGNPPTDYSNKQLIYETWWFFLHFLPWFPQVWHPQEIIEINVSQRPWPWPQSIRRRTLRNCCWIAWWCAMVGIPEVTKLKMGRTKEMVGSSNETDLNKMGSLRNWRWGLFDWSKLKMEHALGVFQSNVNSHEIMDSNGYNMIK